jgi:hypothetical protein
MGRDAAKPYFADVGAQVQAHGLSAPDALVDFYAGLLVDGDLTAEARQSLVDYLNADGPLDLSSANSIDIKARGLVHLALAVPTFQLA